MLSRLNYAWRLFATALSFTCFGLGGLLLWVVVFPALSLFIRDPRRLSVTARWVIHQSFRAFVGLMHGLGIFSYETHGLEKLNRRGLLVLANHPSLIDVVFLISFTARADCVVKAALAANPFTRGPVLAAGFICNNGGPAMVEDSVASLRAGNNLIIFPEGTRTPVNGRTRQAPARRLQRGGARQGGRDAGADPVQPLHARQGRALVADPGAPPAFPHRGARRHAHRFPGGQLRQRGPGRAPPDRTPGRLFHHGDTQ